MRTAKINTTQRLVRIPRGKCSGCDKTRVRYKWEEWAGTPGQSYAPFRREAYCGECHPEIAKADHKTTDNATVSTQSEGAL